MRKVYLSLCLTAFGWLSAFSQTTVSPPPSGGEKSLGQLREAPGSRMFREYTKSITPSFALAPAMSPDTGFPVVYANMVYDSEWLKITDYADIPFGIYSFEASQNIMPEGIITSSELEGVAGTILDGKYYFVVTQTEPNGTISGGSVYAYDVATWKLRSRQSFLIDSNPGAVAFQMATDHATETIYSISFNDDCSGYVFGTFDPSDLTRTVIGESEYLHALAVDNDGVIYGINTDAELLKIDRRTGATTVVGPTGVDIAYMKQSGTIDPQSGIFYWAAYTGANKESLYRVDKTTGLASKIGDFPRAQEFVGMAIAPEAVSPDAPGRGNEINVTLQGGELTGKVTFSVPAKNFGGQALTGTLEAILSLDGVEYARKSVEAASVAEMSVTVEDEGLHSVAVRFANESGVGLTCATSAYFGVDAPAAVIEPMATLANGKGQIIWDAPETGMHAGYIEPSTFTYSVWRLTAGGEELIASNLRDTEYTDEFPTDNMVAVRYRIVPFSGMKEGVAAITNKIVFGESFSAPVTWYLDDPDEFEMFTAIDANGDGFSWESGTWRYTQNKTIYAQNMWNDDDRTDADDWFISPKVSLEPGRRYYFKFSAANTMMTKREIFEVMIGKEPTISSLSTRIQEARNLETSDIWERVRIPVEVSEKGNYNFGIHCISKAPDYYRLYIDTIAVEAGPFFAAPQAVSDFKITPAERGGMSATLSFRLPTQTVEGKPLTEITKLLIYRGTRDEVSLVATLTDNLVPGAEMEYVDKDPANRFNTWKVVPCNAVGEGDLVEGEAYVGPDEPVSLEAVNIKITKDDVVLTWDPASEVGWKGGYVNPEGVTYEVYDGIAYNYLTKGLKERVFSVGTPDEGTPHSQFWGVIPSNEKGRGPVKFTPRYIHGETYKLPFLEEFTNGRTDNLYWFAGNKNQMVSSAWRLGVDESADGKMQYIGQPGAFNTIYPAPFDFSDATSPVMTFDVYRNTEADGDKVSVWVSTSTQDNFQKVCDVEISSTVGTKSVDLSAFKGEPRVCVAFRCESVSNNTAIVFDNINLYDLKGDDLGVVSMSADGEVYYNDTASFSGIIANYGSTVAENYTVNLYKDGKTLVESLEGAPVEAGKRMTYTFSYPASLSDPDAVSFHMEIDYESDTNPDNDASDPVVVKIRKPYAPAVDDLTLNHVGDETRLDWSRPAYADGFPEMEVTDGVEDYIDFAISKIGSWTMIDGDGAYTYSVSGLEAYPHQYGPAAFQVFNPKAIGAPARTNLDAHSGDKYFIAFSPQGGKADDWMFSPELSSGKQTVSFYVRGLNSAISETYEVYYSETAPSIANATRIQTGKTGDAWEKVSVDLPEGAKYFAIRYTSSDGNALMVDDITYMAAPRDAELELVGYHVYADGVRLTDAPLEQTGYVLEDAGADEYYVTVQYAGLESGASNKVSVSGVGEAFVSDEDDAPAYSVSGLRLGKDARERIVIKNRKKELKK